MTTPLFTVHCSLFTRFRRPRHGAAILVVVAMLAILLITAVAFTILMRVERNASANYRHDVGARQMLSVALAQAIADIDAAPPLGVGDAVYPPWGTPYQWTNGTHAVDIPADVLPSIDTTVNNFSNVLAAHILSMDAMKYIPKSLRSSVQKTKSEWRGVVDNSGEPVGRYAYIAVNVSGLLDANIVCASNRWVGVDPSEIQLNSTILADLANTNLFLTSRTADVRYETLKDLAENNLGLTTNLSNFEVYSRAPDMLQPDGVTPKVYIGGNVASLQANHDAITNAFSQCGVVAPNFGVPPDKAAEWAYRALVDYVDTDSILEGTNDVERFNRPSSEAVPQISAVYMNMKYSCVNLGSPVVTNKIHTMTNTFQIIFAYPYVANSGLVNLEVFVDIVNSNTACNIPGLMPPSIQNTANLAIGGSPPAIFPPNILFTSVTTATSNAVPSFVFETGFNKIEVRDITNPTTIYDKITTPIKLSSGPFSFTNTFGSYTNWAETIDPRINWNGLAPNQWVLNIPFSTMTNLPGYKPSKPTANYGSLTQYCLTNYIGATNLQLVADGIRLQPGDDPNWDPIAKQMLACVANRPLRTVGELGFLPINRHLTLTLYDHGHNNTYNLLPTNGYHQVLDYFTVQPTNSQPRRGLVALGSNNTNVHASVFYNLPLQEWKTPATSARLNDANNVITNIAAWLVSHQTNGVQRLSDLAAVWRDASVLGKRDSLAIPVTNTGPAYAIAQAIYAANLPSTVYSFGEFEREALIRNAAELYTTRHQFFTIFVKADSFTTKYGFSDMKHGSVLGTAQAVFQVWRDPVKGPDGKHHCFVRLYKVL